MSILTSVSDLLALLAAGAALIAATRALQVAGRLARGPVTTVQPPTAQAEPTDPAPPAKPATTSRNGGGASTVAASGSSARGNGLREQLRAFLTDRPGQELSLAQIANGVGRSSATVSYALDKLIETGDIELTSPKPRRYRITPAGASAPQQAIAPAAAPATDHAERSSDTPAGDPRRSPTLAGTPRPGRVRGGLRDEVRAVLAARPGQALSLAEISSTVGRASATVSYQLDRLLQSGDVIQTGDKPRRYAIADDARRSAPTSPPETEETAASTAKSPGRGGRREPRRAHEPGQRTTSRSRPASSGGRGRKKTADAATAKVAASAK